VGRTPNLAVTIVLYVFGFLLVALAIILLLQAYGVAIPRPAVGAIVLLAIGVGILTGIQSRRWT
jgi:hypothetical protein